MHLRGSEISNHMSNIIADQYLTVQCQKVYRWAIHLVGEKTEDEARLERIHGTKCWTGCRREKQKNKVGGGHFVSLARGVPLSPSRYHRTTGFVHIEIAALIATN